MVRAVTSVSISDATVAGPLLAPHRKRKGSLLSYTPDTAIRVEEEERWQRAGDARERNLQRGGPQTACI